MRAEAVVLNEEYIKPSYYYTGKIPGFILGELNLFFLIFPFADFFVTFGKWINLTGATNAMNQVLALLSLAYIFLSAKKINIKWSAIITMVLFIGLMLISQLWVDGPMKPDAKKFIIRTVLTVFQTLVIVKIFREKGKDYLLDVLKKMAIIICILSALSIAIFPTESSWTIDDTGRKQAFFASPNNLGQFLSFAFLMFNFYKLKQFHWSVILALNGLIIYQAMGCDSKTSLTGGILCFILYHFRFLVRPFLVFVICAGFFLPYYTYQFEAGEAEKIEFAKRDMSFTGRSDVWHIMIDDYKEQGKDLLGFGAGGYWGEEIYHPKASMHELDWEPHQGHNGYLDLKLMLGTVGVVFFLMYIYQYFANIFKVIDNKNIVILYLSVIITINNITETSWFRAKHFYFVLLMLILWYTNFRLLDKENEVDENTEEESAENLAPVVEKS